ncbi:3040_t:CDS:2, partial [Gigaspora margarita]
TSTTRTSKIIDLVSSDESETNSLVSSDYDTQEDNYFQDNDDDNKVNLVIKRLLTMLATKLIQYFRGKFSSKSLLNDELVLLKLATYLYFQKFKVNPTIVKNYIEQQIIPQLGKQLLRKKEMGLGIYISDFLTEMIGPLRDDFKEAREND